MKVVLRIKWLKSMYMYIEYYMLNIVHWVLYVELFLYPKDLQIAAWN